MKSLVVNIIFLAILLLIMARFLSIWTGTSFPLNLITSNSMSPSLMEGDVVAWTPANIDDIEVGDVVVFKSHISWPDEKLIIHRVVDIKRDSLGRPLLETKGDANRWTDQAGPHIPEPYVREDQVLGKTLSIGKQPLKIPFIGYLGIWVNQGLDSLSQPTAAKGSLAYIGVFAPLTISVVILVILIFTIPEKTKTIKEKLRFYTFGRRPLSFKKTLIFFLIAYIVFFNVIHCFAYDSISASVGIENESPESTMDFGRIKQGTTSFPKDTPIINPSVLPVKGIIFGRGNVSEYVSKDVFELGPGERKTASLTATAPNGTQNGSYMGDIMIYSSPFWLLYPDSFIRDLYNWNAEATVFCLDTLSALFLTFITIFLLTSISFIEEKYISWTTDRSWRHASKLILKKETIKRTSLAKKKIKQALRKRVGWISKIDLTEIDSKKPLSESLVKPVLASLAVIPILLLISDQIMAMIIAVLIAGLVAYFISCKVRRKIILTAVLVISIAITYMMIHANIILMAKDYTVIELMTLALGAMGVYLLLLAVLLIPLSLLSWFLTRLIRNLKERKDPLLILEGSCDL